MCRSWVLHLYVFEIKHIPLYKSTSDLLIGPRYEQFVVVVCLTSGSTELHNMAPTHYSTNLFRDAGCEIDWSLQVHTIPYRTKLKEYFPHILGHTKSSPKECKALELFLMRKQESRPDKKR